MLVELQHPRAGMVRVTGSPIRLDATPALSASAPPWLGQHSVEVLTELGVEADTIQRLRADQALIG
jgi:formyl-CoA transferase/CoA:oxalate CoA-transferase